MSTATSLAPATEALHADCWRALDGGAVQLIAYRCKKCGTHYLPRVLTCTGCGCDSFDRVNLSPTGSLYTYTIVYGSGGAWPAQYAVGYVDFPEGVRVFGQLREIEPYQLEIGARVCVEPAELYTRKDGTKVTSFRFRVVNGGAR